MVVPEFDSQGGHETLYDDLRPDKPSDDLSTLERI